MNETPTQFPLVDILDGVLVELSPLRQIEDVLVDVGGVDAKAVAVMRGQESMKPNGRRVGLRPNRRRRAPHTEFRPLGMRRLPLGNNGLGKEVPMLLVAEKKVSLVVRTFRHSRSSSAFPG